MAAKISMKTVFRAPQATDDVYAVGEDTLTYLDVLDNDLGGAAASLYSLSSSTTGQYDASAGRISAIGTALGASAAIVATGDNAGTISYDASALDYLAEGETITDTFTYVIRLANGTISIATVSVTITGVNDRPVVADVTVSADAGVVEDGAAYIGAFGGDDIDSDDDGASLVYEIVGQPDEGTVAIDASDPTRFIFDPGTDFQDLEEGQTRTVTFQYRAVDRHGAASDPATVSITVTGRSDITNGSAIDGYIADALVFRDSNADGLWNHESFVDADGNGRFDVGESFVDADGDGAFTAEAFTFTDSQGNFSGLGGTGRIVIAPVIDGSGVVVTRDISTGAAFTGVLSAPEGSSIVSPLTTLIDALAGAGASAEDIAAAEAAVKAALGLPAKIDLGTFDPIAAATSGGDPEAIAQALEVQKAAIQVANILAVIDAGLAAAGVEGGSQLATAALAEQIAGAEGEIDLGNADLLAAVVVEAAAASGDPDAEAALAAQAEALAASLASINTVIDTVEPGSDPLAALAAVVAAQIVAQSELADAASLAVANGEPLDADAFSGSALNEQLDAAAEQVEVIVPVDDSGSSLGAPGRPVVDAGVRVNAAEIADGVVVTISYGASAGVSEGDSLVLLLGGVEIASHVLTSAEVPTDMALTYIFVVPAASLGADGAKVLSARFAGASGENGPESLPLLLTVDTAAPDAPARVVAVEGTILTVLEAMNGTEISGTVEAGSTVQVTLTNGAQSLVRQAAVSGSTFTLALSSEDIAALGEGYVRFSAVATDAAGNVGQPSAAGQYFYTSQPIVDGDSRIDGEAGSAYNGDIIQGEDSPVGVSPIDGGGFAVHWVVDTDADDHGDTLAVERYDASGAKVGGVVVLEGIPSWAVRNTDLLDGWDLAALDNGGYALTFALERESATRFFTFNGTSNGSGAANTISLLIPGVPQEIFVNFATGTPSFALRGIQNGSLATVPVTLVNGRIEITQAILDSFSVDNRLTLIINGVGSGQQINFGVTAEFDVYYDTEAPLANITVNTLANGGGGLTLSPPGRPELFDLDQFTPGASGAFFNLIITPGRGTQSINLTGFSNAVVQSNGQIILPVTPDANGIVRVPTSILDQLGSSEGIIFLAISGLVPGSAVTGSMQYRPPLASPEGVFQMAFDNEGQALPAGAERLDGPAAPTVLDEDSPLGVTALPGGGYAVHWALDSNGDGFGDGLAVQRFDAAGARDGGVVSLQGITSRIFGNIDAVESVSLTALDNGGYALAYSLEREGSDQLVNVTGQGAVPVSVQVTGRPDSFEVGSLPAGLTYQLSGIGNNGLPLTVGLTAVGGVIEIDSSVLDQFSIDNRFSLLISGIPGGQSGSVLVSVEEDVSYAAGAAEADLGASWTVQGNSVGILAVAGGRPVEFQVTSASGQGNFALLRITTAVDSASFDLTGTGATRLPDGVIQYVYPGTNSAGTYAVPPALLAALGGHDAQAILIVGGLQIGSSFTGTVTVQQGSTIPEGVFVQTFGPDGVALADSPERLDMLGAAGALDDESTFGVTALPGGGFAVHWAIDSNADGEGDGLAVQRFAASGAKDGAVVILQDIPSRILDNPDQVESLDLTALDNGGYALAYGMELENFGQAFNFQVQNTAPVQLVLAGRVDEIYVGGLPGAATFQLAGIGNDGAPRTIAVTATDGVIDVDSSILDQFSIDNRFTLLISGMALGQTGSVFVTAEEDVSYQAGSPQADFTSNLVVSPAGFGVIGVPNGRPVAFQVDSSSGQGTFAVLRITTVVDTASIDLTGTGANRLSDGVIQYVYPGGTNPAGTYIVPPALLAALGDHDAQAILVIGGLQAGTILSGTVTVQLGTSIPEGVFVQTFGPDGVALDGDLAFVGTLGSDSFAFDASAMGMNMITGFDPLDDIIDLSAIDAIAATAGDDPFTFIGETAFGGTAGELRYIVASDGVHVQLDVDGDQVADFEILVAGQDSLTAADFVL